MWRSLQGQISTIVLPEVSLYLLIVSWEIVSGTDNRECESSCCQKRGLSHRFLFCTGNRQFSYPIPCMLFFLFTSHSIITWYGLYDRQVPRKPRPVGGELHYFDLGNNRTAKINRSTYSCHSGVCTRSSHYARASRAFLMKPSRWRHEIPHWFRCFASHNFGIAYWTYAQGEIDDHISGRFSFSARMGYFSLPSDISPFIGYPILMMVTWVILHHHWTPICNFPFRKIISKRVRMAATPKRNRTQGMCR